MSGSTSRAAALALGLCLVACADADVGPSVPDLDGVLCAPLDVPAGDVHVLVFTSDECPIANAYAPTLGALHETWTATGRVRLFLVHVDPDMTAARAAEHAAAYALPGRLLLDPAQTLAHACGATITPEAVVRVPGGQVYRGRIDDQWRALGSRAPAAAQRDLARAVELALAGSPVPAPHPPAVGCLFPEPRR